MSGYYAHITVNDYSRGDGTVFLEGRTHGCSCCSSEETVTKKSLIAHIEQLQEEIAYAKELLEEWFPERP